MSKLEILTEPDPKLHEKCKKVKVFDDKLKKLALDMAETIKENHGTIGLAAPQVGNQIRMIAIEYDPKKYLSDEELKTCKEKPIPLTVLVNPKITWHSKEKEFGDEGCLSLPDIEIPIERAKDIHVLAQNLEGKKLKIRASGYFARVIQHETDHLDGILITDLSKAKLNRVIFMGTPVFAETILKRLIKSPYHPYLVITEQDRPRGRGKKIFPNPVKTLAIEHKIEIWQPNKISEIKTQLSELAPDLMVVAAYGQILPKSILEIPKYGSVNVHPSLLPKHRGPSPIQAAIITGEKTTGVTIIKMDEKMDHGPILSQAEFPLDANISYPTLSDNLAHLGSNLLVRTISQYIIGNIKPIAQKHKLASYNKLIKKGDGHIDWSKTPEEILRLIKAYNPWPGTYTMIHGKRLKICQAHLENGKLIIDKVQLEGKNEINFQDFLNGYRENLDFLSKI